MTVRIYDNEAQSTSPRGIGLGKLGARRNLKHSKVNIVKFLMILNNY